MSLLLLISTKKVPRKRKHSRPFQIQVLYICLHGPIETMYSKSTSPTSISRNIKNINHNTGDDNAKRTLNLFELDSDDEYNREL